MRGLPFRECFQGFRTLRLHPLRSLLTILGIFIGVASVIWLMAFGEGISHAVQKQIEGLGADNIIVRSIKPVNSSSQTGFILEYGLTRQDHEAVSYTHLTLPTILLV